MADRPELSSAMSESEFGRWYWTMAELQPFARAFGLSASGPKAELAGRIAAHLAGRPERPSTRSARPPSAQLTGELSRSTPIPKGQRSTSHLRAFFTDEVGPSFRFNGHMRAFLAAGAGTLGDAVDHWYATVGTELPRQSTSLEFNRFTRLWHRSHPDGSAEECRKAWSTYRALPVDQRPPIGEI
ncbi:MAG: SAP domain-containing protein [Microthrixaceae bacterium]|nr:SAP domain-containing protein [Microthrixaceae bacterium]